MKVIFYELCKFPGLPCANCGSFHKTILDEKMMRHANKAECFCVRIK